MLDCSVAKQKLVAFSSEKAKFYGIVRARGDIKANLTDLRADQDATGGDHYSRQQGSTRNLYENMFGKGAAPFDQRVVDTEEAYRRKEFQLVSVDTLLNWADTGTKEQTSERLTSLLSQMPLRLIEGQTKALVYLTLTDEEHRASHGWGWRRS